MAGHQRYAAQPLCPACRCRRVAQGNVERGRDRQSLRNRIRARTPALRCLRRQGRRFRKRRSALRQCRKYAMRQPPWPACQHGQTGRHHSMRRGFQTQDLHQHDRQHRPHLGVISKWLARRAVDQRIEIDPPAQHFARDRACQCSVGFAPHARQSSTGCLIECFPSAQHRVDKVERRAARGKSGNIHRRALMAERTFGHSRNCHPPIAFSAPKAH